MNKTKIELKIHSFKCLSCFIHILNCKMSQSILQNLFLFIQNKVTLSDGGFEIKSKIQFNCLCCFILILNCKMSCLFSAEFVSFYTLIVVNCDVLFCAVFCVDYSTELDLVISGSSDCTVKLWQMSTGSCLATKLGHENWLISVSPKSKVYSMAI